MTKRKSVVSKLLLLVALMTIVSCCFLGSTFARYISTGTGTATIQVAKWAINVGDTGSGAAKFDKLSPLAAPYEGTVRANPSGKIFVASMSNDGDVDALVKFTVGEVEVACNAAYGTQGVATDGIPTADEVKEVFSVKFYYALTKSADAATNEITDAGVTLNAAGGDRTVIYIYAEATWTSDTTSDTGTINGEKADLRDTYIGKYVTKVVFNYTWEAAQATERP
jgi:lipoprotein